MSVEKQPDEATLHAYVDGELDAETVREVEAWLADHPDARARIAEWRRQSADLKRHFDPVLGEPVPDGIKRAARSIRSRGTLRWAAQIAAGLALFLAGGLTGWELGRAPSQDFPPGHIVAENAVTAHLVYVSETRHPVEVTAAEEAHLVAWLSKRLGHALSVPSLTAQGFHLVGGRLLPSKAGPAAQFMFEDGSGERLTLYVGRNMSGKGAAFRLYADGAVRSFYWLDGDFGYAMSGEIAKERLLLIARAVYEQLEAGAAS